MAYDGYAPVENPSKKSLRKSHSAPSPGASLPSYSSHRSGSTHAALDPLAEAGTQAPKYEYNPEDEVHPQIAPPTYDSVFGAAGSAIAKTTDIVRNFGENKEEGKKKVYTADTWCEVFWKFILVNTLLCGVPLAQSVIGAYYWNECPLSMKIPLYMVLNGVIFFLIGIRIWAPNWVDKNDGRVGHVLAVVMGIGIVAAIGWFIAGSYWVFKKFPSVEYEPTVVKPDPIVRVDPMKDIDGPFTNNTFIVTTKEGTAKNTLRIKWNGKDREYLEIGSDYIDLCDKKITYNGNGTTEAGEWSILFNYTTVKIWFNDEILIDSNKNEYTTCYFWKKKIDEINAGYAAVTVRFKDDKLNEEYFSGDFYCNKGLYLFAFVSLVIVYALGGGLTLVGICVSGQ